MNHYLVHGIKIQCEEAFDWSPIAEDPDSIRLDFRPPPRFELDELDETFHVERATSHWELIVGAIRVDVSESRILVHAPPVAATARLERAILPKVREILDPQVTLFHASAVAHGDSGFLLLGSSGAGKSSTAWALHRRFEWDLLADDHVLVDDKGQIIPSGTSVRLRTPTDRTERLPAPDSTTGKAHVTPRCWRRRPVRLEAFVRLSTTQSAPQHRRCDGVEGLEIVSSALVRLRTSRDYRANLFRRLNRLVETVPVLVFEFSRSDHYWPDHCGALETSLLDLV